MLLSKDEVAKILPQKFPFRFINTVENLDKENKEIVCEYYFDEESYFFEGHFPDKPIVPGVILVESMAQSWLILISKILDENTKVGYLAKITSSTFFNPVFPKNEITIKSKIIDQFGGFYTILSTVYISGRKIAKSKLVLSL